MIVDVHIYYIQNLNIPQRLVVDGVSCVWIIRDIYGIYGIFATNNNISFCKILFHSVPIMSGKQGEQRKTCVG